mmetsp:Transcript_55019/g.80312  ORF Transcript_55019/g.80312 Transcript_55019/m.80312 type:complete len:316 (+) Transcript_55019:124-1071(+)
MGGNNEDQEGVWTVELTWNGGRKIEQHSVHLTLEEANETAKKELNDFYGRDMEEVYCDEPGQPFNAFTCIEYGAGSVLVTVEKTPPESISSIKNLKAALLQRNADTSGKKQELVDRLTEILGGTSNHQLEEVNKENNMNNGNKRRSPGDEGAEIAVKKPKRKPREKKRIDIHAPFKLPVSKSLKEIKDASSYGRWCQYEDKLDCPVVGCKASYADFLTPSFKVHWRKTHGMENLRYEALKKISYDLTCYRGPRCPVWSCRETFEDMYSEKFERHIAEVHSDCQNWKKFCMRKSEIDYVQQILEENPNGVYKNEKA